MTISAADERWMAAAIALAWRGRGLSRPNPNVGCIIVKDARVVGRGWTQAGGRPHAEAMALAEAEAGAQGATAYVTLEPCDHASERGPPCAQSLIDAGVSRVVIAARDPDPRTNGAGSLRLRAAGIAVSEGVLTDAARAAMAGWWWRMTQGRAFVTLKLATSLDGCIARDDGESKWITGEAARRHAHLLRAQCDAILVGRGTWEADQPSLDIRLPGLEDRSPRKMVLSTSPEREGGPAELVEEHRQVDPIRVDSPQTAATLNGINTLLVEGGAETAAAFLRAQLVDRLILYRAPILIGGGKASLAQIGLTTLADAHGQWQLSDARQLGPDRVEIYDRAGQGR